MEKECVDLRRTSLMSNQHVGHMYRVLSIVLADLVRGNTELETL